MTETGLTYQYLVDLLKKCTEFSSLEENDCDAEIMAVGKTLWKQWGENDRKRPFDWTGVPTSLEDCGVDLNKNSLARKIAIMALNGYTVNDVAATLHRTPKCIRDQFSAMGFYAAIDRVFPFTEEQLTADIAELKSISKVAKKYNRSTTFIRSGMDFFAVDGSQFKRRPRFNMPKEELQELYSKYRNANKIAALCNAQPYTIRHALRKYAIV